MQVQKEGESEKDAFQNLSDRLATEADKNVEFVIASDAIGNIGKPIQYVLRFLNTGSGSVSGVCKDDKIPKNYKTITISSEGKVTFGGDTHWYDRIRFGSKSSSSGNGHDEESMSLKDFYYVQIIFL